MPIRFDLEGRECVLQIWVSRMGCWTGAVMIALPSMPHLYECLFAIRSQILLCFGRKKVGWKSGGYRGGPHVSHCTGHAEDTD